MNRHQPASNDDQSTSTTSNKQINQHQLMAPTLQHQSGFENDVDVVVANPSFSANVNNCDVTPVDAESTVNFEPDASNVNSEHGLNDNKSNDDHNESPEIQPTPNDLANSNEKLTFNEQTNHLINKTNHQQQKQPNDDGDKIINGDSTPTVAAAHQIDQLLKSFDSISTISTLTNNNNNNNNNNSNLINNFTTDANIINNNNTITTSKTNERTWSHSNGRDSSSFLSRRRSSAGGTTDRRGSVASSRFSGGYERSSQSNKQSRIIIRKFQKLDEYSLSSTPAPDVKIGQRVAYKEYYGNEFGTIRWIGRVPQICPDWTVGVEFDNAIGEGDGSLNGRRYFIAKDCFAKFLPLNSVNLVDQHVGRPEPGTMISVMSAAVRPGQMISIQRVSTVHVQHCFLNAPHQIPGADILAVNTRLHCQCPNCGPCAHVIKPPRTQRIARAGKNATHMCQFSTYTCCGMESSDEAMCTYEGNKISSLPPPTYGNSTSGFGLPPLGNSWFEGAGYLSNLQAQQSKSMPEEYKTLGAAPEEVINQAQMLRRLSSTRRKHDKTETTTSKTCSTTTTTTKQQQQQQQGYLPPSGDVTTASFFAAAATTTTTNTTTSTTNQLHHQESAGVVQSQNGDTLANNTGVSAGGYGVNVNSQSIDNNLQYQTPSYSESEQLALACGYNNNNMNGNNNLVEYVDKYDETSATNQQQLAITTTTTSTTNNWLENNINNNENYDSELYYHHNHQQASLSTPQHSRQSRKKKKNKKERAPKCPKVVYRNSIENRYLFPIDDDDGGEAIDSMLEADLENLSQARYGHHNVTSSSRTISSNSDDGRSTSRYAKRHQHHHQKHQQQQRGGLSGVSSRTILKSLRSLVSCLSAPGSNHSEFSLTHHHAEGDMNNYNNNSNNDHLLCVVQQSSDHHEAINNKNGLKFYCSEQEGVTTNCSSAKGTGLNGIANNQHNINGFKSLSTTKSPTNWLLNKQSQEDLYEDAFLEKEKHHNSTNNNNSNSKKELCKKTTTTSKHNNHQHLNHNEQQQIPFKRHVSSSSDCGFSSASQNSMNCQLSHQACCSPTTNTLQPMTLEDEVKTKQIYQRIVARLLNSSTSVTNDELHRLRKVLFEPEHIDDCCLHSNLAANNKNNNNNNHNVAFPTHFNLNEFDQLIADLIKKTSYSNNPTTTLSNNNTEQLLQIKPNHHHHHHDQGSTVTACCMHGTGDSRSCSLSTNSASRLEVELEMEKLEKQLKKMKNKLNEQNYPLTQMLHNHTQNHDQQQHSLEGTKSCNFEASSTSGSVTLSSYDSLCGTAIVGAGSVCDNNNTSSNYCSRKETTKNNNQAAVNQLREDNKGLSSTQSDLPKAFELKLTLSINSDKSVQNSPSSCAVATITTNGEPTCGLGVEGVQVVGLDNIEKISDSNYANEPQKSTHISMNIKSPISVEDITEPLTSTNDDEIQHQTQNEEDILGQVELSSTVNNIDSTEECLLTA